jgi:hypothetical protein
MKHTTSTLFSGFLVDANGLPAEIDGPADLAHLVFSVVSAARTNPAAQRAKSKRAQIAADLEIAVFLSALGQPGRSSKQARPTQPCTCPAFDDGHRPVVKVAVGAPPRSRHGRTAIGRGTKHR